jgi:hypothetical protein
MNDALKGKWQNGEFRVHFESNFLSPIARQNEDRLHSVKGWDYHARRHCKEC